MDLTEIKRNAGAREMAILENPKMRISRVDPRDRGPIGGRIDGLTYFSVSHPAKYPAGYVGERVKNIELCAWSPERGEFVL